MNSFHIESMVSCICMYIGDNLKAEVKEGLQDFWSDKLLMYWDTTDVQCKCEELNIELDEEDKLNVLETVSDSFDANMGVSWTEIEMAIMKVKGENDE